MNLLALLSCFDGDPTIDCEDIRPFFQETVGRPTNDPFRHVSAYMSCGTASLEFVRDSIKARQYTSAELAELVRIYSNVAFFSEVPLKQLPEGDIAWLTALLVDEAPLVRQRAAFTLEQANCKDCGLTAAAGLLLPENTPTGARHLATLVLTEWPWAVRCDRLVARVKLNGADGEAVSTIMRCADLQAGGDGTSPN